MIENSLGHQPMGVLDHLKRSLLHFPLVQQPLLLRSTVFERAGSPGPQAAKRHTPGEGSLPCDGSRRLLGLILFEFWEPSNGYQKTQICLARPQKNKSKNRSTQVSSTVEFGPIADLGIDVSTFSETSESEKFARPTAHGVLGPA